MSGDVSWRRGRSEDITNEDAALLARLGRIVGVIDPVPDHVLAAGRAVFSFRDPDAELMRVVELESAGLEAVRGGTPTSRLHFFEFGEVSIDLELTVTGSFCHVVGLVADTGGTAGTTVTLDTQSASFTTVPDEDGRFEVAQVPVGMVRIGLDRGERTKVSTPWFEAG